MSHHTGLSHEEMLIALDQLDQTVEVMGATIQRLKHNLQQLAQSPPAQSRPLSAAPLPLSSPPVFELKGLLDSGIH